MPREQLLSMYRIACIGLSSANRNEPFAPSKADAMRSVNYWRNLLRGMQS